MTCHRGEGVLDDVLCRLSDAPFRDVVCNIGDELGDIQLGKSRRDSLYSESVSSEWLYLESKATQGLCVGREGLGSGGRQLHDLRSQGPLSRSEMAAWV